MYKLSQSTITVPPSLVSELEAWGKWTAKLFGELSRQNVLDPKSDLDDQTWYWTKLWQRWEQQADEDVAADRVKRFASVGDLIAELDL